MTTISRRRLLALPVAMLAPARWPGPGGESATPAERVQFVYDITQLHTGRINGLDERISDLEKLAAYALRYFGFGSPARQDGGGDA